MQVHYILRVNHTEYIFYSGIIEILSFFFILQSLTTSKMRNFQTIKLSQLHEAKTCWTENCWSSGSMSTQCARTDLNKRFLPKPMTTTG